jgi:hypothetical protein
MPSPADPLNLAPNIDVFRNLRTAAKGTKVWFDESTGLFSTQGKGKWQSLSRTFSSQTVTSEGYFGDPVREVFAAARAQIGAAVTQQAFDEAVAGLKMLRQSYTDAKLTALNRVIEDAELGVRRDVQGAIDLRTKYAAYLLFGFSQRMFLPETNHGVCYSFCLDWARRILAGKATFGHSSKAAAITGVINLDAAQKARIMKKVAGRVAPLQHTLSGYSASNFGNTATALNAKYRHLMVGTVVRDPQTIAGTDEGHDIIGNAVGAAVQEMPTYTLFILNAHKKVGHGGHAVGFHLTGTHIHFFDPNVGEFEFALNAQHLDQFFDDWWSAFYMIGQQQYFGTWTLDSVKIR